MAVLKSYILVSDLTLRNLVYYCDLEREYRQLRALPSLDEIVLELVADALESRYDVSALEEF